MADERTAKTILAYEVDQASINRALGSVGKVKKELKDLDSASKVSLNRLESSVQSASRALSGLGLGALGDVGGQAADVLQLRNTLKDALTSITAVEGGVAAAGAGFAAALGPIVAVGAPLLLLKGIMDNLQSSAQNAANAQRAAFEAMKEADERRLAAEKEARTKQAEANRQDIADVEKELATLSKRRSDLQAERRKVDEAFAALGGSFNPGERSRLGERGQELDKAIQETADEYAKLSKRLGDLVIVVDPLIKKRDEETAAAKKLIEQHDLLAETMRREAAQADQLTLRVADRNTLVDQAAKEQAEADDRIIDATRKANADIEGIEQRALERRASIQDQYNKRIVDIARQAAEAAESALRNLQQQREDLTRNLGRDLAQADREAQAKQLDIRLDAQREEARSLREHERNLDEIRRDAQDREFELILNRDFLGLFMSRRQTGSNLDRASRDFVAQQQERRIGAGEQLDDLRRQMAAERQERLIAYQQQLTDAQLNYNRELQLAAQQRQQALTIARLGRNAELTELQNTTRAALIARRNAAAEEIRVAGLVGQARINFLQQERQALLNQSAAYYSSGSTAATGTVFAGSTARAALRDSGGSLRAGQWASIGVPGEAFNGYPLPSGGLFFPTVPGNVTKHTNINPTWNISGNNPDQIGRVMRGQFESLIRTYFVD